MEFSGCLVAIVTPFHSDGRLDIKSLERLVEWHIQEGTDGLISGGATGEAVCLSLSDRKKALDVCLKTAAGRIPIIAGTGTPSTKETCSLTEMALKAGAAGCLVITPFYNKPTQRGCVLHYREVAKLGLPVIMYHNPPRTGVRLTVDTIVEIGQIPGLAAMKDSTGDIEFIRQCKKASSLPILSGDDWLSFEIMRLGGVGTIATVGNLIPKAWKTMIHLCLQSRWAEAKQISDRFQPLCKAVFEEVNPQCIKYVLSLMGKCKAALRLPLVEPTAATQRLLKKELISLSLPFKFSGSCLLSKS